MDLTLKIKMLNEFSKPPEKATEGAAAFDLRSAENIILHVGETKVIPTGMAVEVPEGYEMQVRSRSGLAAKHGVFVTNGIGTIDSDYRGEVGVILTNIGKHPFEILFGDRIAQAVVMPVPDVKIEIVNELSSTTRGVGGFGSTGRG